MGSMTVGMALLDWVLLAVLAAAAAAAKSLLFADRIPSPTPKRSERSQAIEQSRDMR